MRYLVLLLLSLPAAAIADTYGNAVVARVTSVYDGDTFRADIADWPPIVGERVPIRLRGADTPEIRGDCDREIEQARAAKRFSVAALRGAGEIRLEALERGKYFRIVADVLVDGANLAEQLVAAGLARPYDGGTRRGWCD